MPLPVWSWWNAAMATALGLAYWPSTPPLVPTARNCPELDTAAEVTISLAVLSGAYSSWLAAGWVGSATVRSLT